MKKKVFALVSAIVIIAIMVITQSQRGSSVSGTATADGFGGPGALSVTITLKDGKIADVKAEGPKETEGIGSVALEKMPAEMVSKNSIKVDGISGATLSSTGILLAADAALRAAGLNPADYMGVSAAVVAVDRTVDSDIVIVGAGGAGVAAGAGATDGRATGFGASTRTFFRVLVGLMGCFSSTSKRMPLTMTLATLPSTSSISTS